MGIEQQQQQGEFIMDLIKFIFTKKSGNAISAVVEREEHDRIMSVLDYFLPGHNRPTCGMMFVHLNRGDCMWINLGEIEDIAVYYPQRNA